MITFTAEAFLDCFIGVAHFFLLNNRIFCVENYKNAL